MIAVLVGTLFALAGAASAYAGLAVRLEPSILAQPWWALFAGGVVALLSGFAIACAGRGETGRASVAFNLHVAVTLMGAGAIYYWRAHPSIPAVIATALLAQLAIGLVLLVAVVAARKRVGKVFVPSLLAFLAMLGGSVYLMTEVIR
jgi:hypothetical protein